jgi:replicative DNA helicase
MTYGPIGGKYIADDLGEAFRASERAADRGMAGASTGFQMLDHYTNGMGDGQLWTIGGPTGSGKSALAQVIAAHVADGWRAYGEALNQARDTAARMHVDARSRLTLADVRAELRRLSRGGARVALAVVDYLQLVTPSARQGTREREVAETARGLKELAGEFSCPIIGVSQLSREADRAGAPNLSHLRESGEIAQASDVVILLPGVAPDTTTVEAQLAKVRQGRRGPFTLAWHGPSTRFRDPSPVDELHARGTR